MRVRRSFHVSDACVCSISDLTLDIAESRNTGLGRAWEVEECRCPRGYRGLSCEVRTEGGGGRVGRGHRN